MTYALFFLGEYSAMILMSAMTTTLFLGGWLPPFGITALAFVPGIIWFALKTLLVMFVFIWARATLPRFRYDQLMRLGWKVFLPLTLVWVVLTAGLLMSFEALPNQKVKGPHVPVKQIEVEVFKKAVEAVEAVGAKVEDVAEEVKEVLTPAENIKPRDFEEKKAREKAEELPVEPVEGE
jgi:hypothetical protein